MDLRNWLGTIMAGHPVSVNRNTDCQNLCTSKVKYIVGLIILTDLCILSPVGPRFNDVLTRRKGTNENGNYPWLCERINFSHEIVRWIEYPFYYVFCCSSTSSFYEAIFFLTFSSLLLGKFINRIFFCWQPFLFKYLNCHFMWIFFWFRWIFSYLRGFFLNSMLLGVFEGPKGRLDF